MKTIINEIGSESFLEVSDEEMDNDNFVEVTIKHVDGEDEVFTTIMVGTEELLRAVKSYDKNRLGFNTKFTEGI